MLAPPILELLICCPFPYLPLGCSTIVNSSSNGRLKKSHIALAVLGLVPFACSTRTITE